MWMALAFEMSLPKERRIHFRCHQHCPRRSEPPIDLLGPSSKENTRRRSHRAFDGGWTKDWFQYENALAIPLGIVIAHKTNS